MLARSITLICTLLLLADPAPAQRGSHQDWPFGITPAPGSPFDRLDLFNLGILGAKCWDADRPQPKKRQSGRRSVTGKGSDKGDEGPRRLVVRAVFGGGPAQRAGLQLGDLILGVNQDSFGEGCFAPLSRALRQAEAKTGKLLLKVQRGSESLSLECKLKKRGDAALLPHQGKQRQLILKEALAFLAKRLQGDGSYPASLSGNNGQVVQACLAGLAFLAGGSSPRGGKHRKQIQKVLGFVQGALFKKSTFRRDATWDQTNWSLVHAVWFVSECQLRAKNRRLQGFLQGICDELCQRQQASGGYAHGKGSTPNALKYLELNILGGYTLGALGSAQRAGCKVSPRVVKQLLAYLEASAAADGGVGYSTKDGQKGHGNIGRTGIAWLGARALGLGAQPFVEKMRSYTASHCGAVMDGHASLMQHVLVAGLAAAALGGESHQAYWQVCSRDLSLARAPDGSLQPRPWRESLQLSSNSDVSVGEVWTTASWALLLACQEPGKKGGLQGMTRLRSK